jgi:hypothetical protein
MERYCLFIERMEDYAHFCEIVQDVEINTISKAREIHDYFEETYDYLME